MQYVTIFKHELYQILFELFFMIFNCFSMYFSLIFLMEKSFGLLFILLSIVSAREYSLWCPILTDWTRTFSVERSKRRYPWRKKWTEKCLFPTRVALFPFIDNMIKVLSRIGILIWRVNKYVSRQVKGNNWRNESTIGIFTNLKPSRIVLLCWNH